VLLGLMLWAAVPSFTLASDIPSEAQVADAVEAVKKDPNFATEQKVRRLKWAGADEEKAQDSRKLSVPEWLAMFLTWLAESVRLLMWIAIIVLVALLAVLIVRHVSRTERDGRKTGLAPLPTHVRDLDIRPESLPDDIGAAALALWERGEHRAALALLYRGLLSRLVHVHAVPIKASSTEGDCLDLAREHLPAQHVPYAKDVIDTWQRAEYGARDPDTQHVSSLCRQFDREIGAVTPAAVGA
jgi:hypothetical protein